MRPLKTLPQLRGLSFSGSWGDRESPVITSASTFNCAENATLSHSLTANEVVTWSIVGGADAARLELSGSTLRWASNGTKNREAPNDANTDNVYVVTVRATDLAGNYADQTISGTVTNVNETPTDITWGGSHSIAEDSALGTVIGSALAFTDPDAGATGTFSLVDDAGGRFAINGSNQIIVIGVLDYEAATSHNITVRFTDQGALTYDEVFAVTVTDVTETPAEEPPPDDGDIVVEPGEFEVTPTMVTVADGIKFHGKKATGASGKFIYDIGVPIAGQKYTMRYDPDFSLLANSGVTAMVGFGMKQGNNFHLSGLKGDGGAGLKAYEVYGSNWNQTTGFSTTDGGAAAHGTQAGPNWLQIEVSPDGSTYTLRTSGDSGLNWTDEFSDIVPSPHDDMVDDYTSFGIAVMLESADAGPFSVKIDLWMSQVHEDALMLSGDMQSGSDYLALSGDASPGIMLLGDTSGTPAYPLWISQMYGEVIVKNTTTLSMSQVYSEVIALQASALHTSQVYAEAIALQTSALRTSQVYVEVIISV